MLRWARLLKLGLLGCDTQGWSQLIANFPSVVLQGERRRLGTTAGLEGDYLSRDPEPHYALRSPRPVQKKKQQLRDTPAARGLSCNRDQANCSRLYSWPRRKRSPIT
ncbi:hypothetical protein F4821DRAFT_243141 [Hypoxylon rubiginosum]|uniref:Uncharacterized protein n=1 Tax=Hypoxylon rubiginosum TaxID=110542 RepID=A0ACC0CVJ6_9PEZI|nr:hypothetical protein F4821DRAFT_243141 [Hypoxylon rubiginosum]